MYISDKEVKEELKSVMEISIPKYINICIPILRGGNEILKRMPEQYKKNWKIFPITIRRYSDELKQELNHTLIDIPEDTLNFLYENHDPDNHVLIVDDIYHTGKTLKILQTFMEFNFDMNMSNVYYFIYANKSGIKNDFLHQIVNSYWVRTVSENDWIEFEWEIERNKVNK